MSCLTRAVIACDQCKKVTKHQRCSKCRMAFYCSRECQKQHYRSHKRECSLMSAQQSRDLVAEYRPVIPDSLRTDATTSFDCAICLETVPKRDCQRFSPCGHVFCGACLLTHHNEQTMSKGEEYYADPNTKSPVLCPLCRTPLSYEHFGGDGTIAPPVDEGLAEHEAIQNKLSPFLQCDMEYEDAARVVLRAHMVNKTLQEAHDHGTSQFEDCDEFLEGMRFGGEGLDRILERAKSEGGEIPLNVALTRTEVHKYLKEWKLCLDLTKKAIMVPSLQGEVLRPDLADFRMHFFFRILEILKATNQPKDMRGALQFLGSYLHFGVWNPAVDPRTTPPVDDEFNKSHVLDMRKFLHYHAEYCLMMEEYDQALSFFDGLVEMNRISGGIHKIAAQAKRKLGDLDGAIELTRQGLAYEEPWNGLNRWELEQYLKELTKDYNSELMDDMDDAEWHEAYQNAIQELGGRPEEESDKIELIKAFRAKFRGGA